MNYDFLLKTNNYVIDNMKTFTKKNNEYQLLDSFIVWKKDDEYGSKYLNLSIEEFIDFMKMSEEEINLYFELNS